MDKPIKVEASDITSRSRAINKPGIYTILPKGNRVPSTLPSFDGAIAQVLTTPALGAKFTEHELQVQPGGGTPEPIDDGLEAFLFVLEGQFSLEVDGKKHKMAEGGFFWLPPDLPYSLKNSGESQTRALWLRRRYEAYEGIDIPDPIIANEKDVEPIPEDTYYERHLIPYDDELGFDMAFNLLLFEPGIYFSFVESHIMEHGLYMLAGRGLYFLNGDFIEVEKGDYIYMAPYCPQTFYATGWDGSSYILYKDVNRDYLAEL
jgi:(S)-ureidoglycine aminohydrolase